MPVNEKKILIPEFLQTEQDSYAVLAAACEFICETSCEPDYEGCGWCQLHECVCQTCQGGCQGCQSGQCGVCQISQGPTITPWSWTSSNGSASTALTTNAHTAVISGGYLSDFSYLVWNDLCDKVNATAIAAGDAWIVNWGTLAATKMSSSNKNMTAVRFNALKNNIGARVSTGILDVEKGATIYGSYFITLATKLNTWINSL